MASDEVNQKQGVVNKCPSCGGVLKAFATVCEYCGHELAGVNANRTVTDLSNRFAQIEADVDRTGLTGGKRESEINSRKGRFIRDFPIPNSRDDLLSLIHFIHPKIQSNLKPDPNSEDWRIKFKEVMALAKNAYKSDAKIRAEFEELERTLTTTISGELKTSARRNPLVAIGIGVVAIAVVAGLVTTQMDKRANGLCMDRYDKAAAAENTRLETIAASIVSKQMAGDFAQARMDLTNVRWNVKEESCKQEAAHQDTARWESRKSELAAGVNQAQADAQKALDEQVAQKKIESDRQAAEKADALAKEAVGKRKAVTNKEW